MNTGVQFTGTIEGGQWHRWFTFNWPAGWHVVWSVVPMTNDGGAPQIEWDVQVERAATDNLTYWITVRNLGQAPVEVEARYAVLG